MVTESLFKKKVKQREKCDISKLLFSLSLFPSLVCICVMMMWRRLGFVLRLGLGPFCPHFQFFQFFVRRFIYNFQL